MAETLDSEARQRLVEYVGHLTAYADSYGDSLELTAEQRVARNTYREVGEILAELVPAALLAAEQRAEEAERERDAALKALRRECGSASRFRAVSAKFVAPHKAAEEETDGHR